MFEEEEKMNTENDPLDEWIEEYAKRLSGEIEGHVNDKINSPWSIHREIMQAIKSWHEKEQEARRLFYEAQRKR